MVHGSRLLSGSGYVISSTRQQGKYYFVCCIQPWPHLRVSECLFSYVWVLPISGMFCIWNGSVFSAIVRVFIHKPSVIEKNCTKMQKKVQNRIILKVWLRKLRFCFFCVSIVFQCPRYLQKLQMQLGSQFACIIRFSDREAEKIKSSLNLFTDFKDDCGRQKESRK